MTDLNEKLDAAAQLNDEELKNVAGGGGIAYYGCGKCEFTVEAEEIEIDKSGKRRHKGCGGLIFDLRSPFEGGIPKPVNIKVFPE